MRNGQNNNKRMRGRSGGNHGNNRRGQNPMTRVFESNGPDIKIRGTASHIAEKYVQLARDARSSGDPVAAENYYQHAEHYFRLIAAAQEQLRQSQPQQQQPPRAEGESSEDFSEEDNYSNFGAEPGFAPQPQQFTQREQSQPYPQQREQPREYREPRDNPRQQQTQPQDSGASGLPSFITGGAPQPAAPFDGGGAPQGERFAHRRRRPRAPRPEGQTAAVPQESGDLAGE